MEQQQGTSGDFGSSYQMDLFGPMGEVRRRGRRGDGIALEPRPEQQASAASEKQRPLAYALMERVCDPTNLNKAYKRVKANKGAPGIDGMRTTDLRAWLKGHKEELVESLLGGTYEPDPVRGVEIPKPGGGVRQLGIPTVRDRFVQQAIHQVLESILDPTFSERSYGFRPGRRAEDALRQAQADISEGYYVAVDIDVSKFFDRVHHDRLVARLARYVGDKHLLRIVRRFLEVGIMQQGVCVRRHKGTPQGGPLSPLLANLVLDELDKELEERGHRFCRYADDVQIYVGSHAAGERVMASITRVLEDRLRLKVNLEKSKVATGTKRTFLGFRLLSGNRLGIAPKRLRRAKARIRQITRRNRGVSLERMIRELNSFLGGWLN
ncbi:MAG: group II intron reverse transcriptase/maturase, partial [Dehalococcoidia bacterium]